MRVRLSYPTASFSAASKGQMILLALGETPTRPQPVKPRLQGLFIIAVLDHHKHM
jgi:hypothetical protein